MTRKSADNDHGRQLKIGLALGSGSARGLAHIGVLRAINETGINIDVIAGTSMGALIGAVFAAGKLDGLTARFLDFDWKSIITLLDPVFPRSGLIDGQKITDFVRAHVPATNIEDLPIPFRAVATCIMSGEEVVFGTGDLIEAVRASISVPGIFTPVRNDGRVLVDGGLVNPVPVSVVRAMSADLIIAVDLNHDIVASRAPRPDPRPYERPYAQTMTRLLATLQTMENPVLAQFKAWMNKEPVPGIFDVLLTSIYIMQARITQASLRQDMPDILIIRPPLGTLRFMEFDRAEEIIQIGYECALEQLKVLTVASKAN